MSQTNIFEVELVEKDLIEVVLTTVDVLPTSSQRLQDLSDISIQNLLNQQYLRYNATTQKWENVTVDIILQENSVFNESPTKLTDQLFRTENNFLTATLQVFLNGIKEKYITITASNEFRFDLPTISTDIVEVNYVKG